MIIYLCIKYQSNTPIFSKDIARKPKVYVRDGRTGRTDGRTDSGDTICPPPIDYGGGIINTPQETYLTGTLRVVYSCIFVCMEENLYVKNRYFYKTELLIKLHTQAL